MRQALRQLQEEKDTEVYNLNAEKEVLAHKVSFHTLSNLRDFSDLFRLWT